MNNAASDIHEPLEFHTPENQKAFVRFGISQRIEHIIFLTAFSILGITGLVQKFIASPISQTIVDTLGGIVSTRFIHHIAAFVLMWVSIYHIIALLYRVMVLRVDWTMMPVLDDFRHLFTDLGYYFGLRQTKAYYGRYNYAEKVEYLAVVWGTIIMAITGFIMWNPITTTRFVPGEVIPAAKAAHGAEAILAVLAIIIWHFYHVHIKRLNKSMFTGQLTFDQMEEEHPAELETFKEGRGWQRSADEVIRRRQRSFIPVAVILGLALSLGVIWFITVEPATAIATVPQVETAVAFVPVTPTPRPTPSASPTPAASTEVGANTWEGTYFGLFSNRCGTCHVRTALSGFSMADYQSTLKGGNSGPGIVPGDPDASQLVIVQQAGGHPGQLTPEELQAVIEWIDAGAPEK